MPKILVLNSGSSSLKFKIFSADDLREEAAGLVERVGLDGSFLEFRAGERAFIKENYPEGLKTHGEAMAAVVKAIKNYLPEIFFVGHRVVHGGEEFQATTEADNALAQKIKKYNFLAPLHNPINLLCLEKALELLPQARQFAVFDTAYYRTLPDYAYLYALPLSFYQREKIRRYGFHGISHQYAANEAAAKIKQPLKKLKIISCHLGSGSSITATKFGQAVDTSMGFTPLEGLMMSTRCGDVDVNVPLFMISQLGLSPEEVGKIFNQQSGLLGVAGLTDMREILAAAGELVVGYEVKKVFSDEEKAKAVLALKMFVYRVVKYIGAYAAAMNGLDVLVFTGGVGERSPAVRKLILKQLKSLGHFKSAVVPADEELMIAREIKAKI